MIAASGGAACQAGRDQWSRLCMAGSLGNRAKAMPGEASHGYVLLVSVCWFLAFTGQEPAEIYESNRYSLSVRLPSGEVARDLLAEHQSRKGHLLAVRLSRWQQCSYTRSSVSMLSWRAGCGSFPVVWQGRELWIFVVKLLRAHGGCLGVKRR